MIIDNDDDDKLDAADAFEVLAGASMGNYRTAYSSHNVWLLCNANTLLDCCTGLNTAVHCALYNDTLRSTEVHCALYNDTLQSSVLHSSGGLRQGAGRMVMSWQV